MLKPGRKLRTTTGLSVEVVRLIGEGGQGEVYRVSVDGQPYALKWYHLPATRQQKEWASEQRDALEGFLLKTAPPDRRFLWPQGVVEDSKGRTFGYLMHLLPERFQSMERLVLGRMKPAPRFKQLCAAAINLSECFRKLHNAGACYKDINLGGPVIDPTNGDVLVCDTDNVRVNKTPGNIIFVFFAAPELILGKGTCQTNTDIHSLAVLLFYMFVRHHPLDGRRQLEVNVFNEAAQRRFYGRKPVFIFDPENEENRPVPGFHDNAIRNWGLYPGYLKALFERAFTEGLHQPERRVREGEWMEAFGRLRDGIWYCTCGVENFLDTEVEKTVCWRCGVPGTMPLVLDFGKDRVHLNADTYLYNHHVGNRLDFATLAAEMNPHPTKKNVWGLKNLSRRKWTYTGKDGEEKDVMPGRSVPIRAGLTINFGKVEGTIVRPEPPIA